MVLYKCTSAHFHEISGQIVIIMRGLPGSGKSHVAKLIRVSEIISNGQFIDAMLRIMLCTYGLTVAGGYL